MMKKWKLYAFWGWMLLMVLSACRDDEWETRSGVTLQEGVPVTLSLSYSTTPQTVKTRVVQDTETEYRVSSLYLWVFNADGTVDWQGPIEGVNGQYDADKRTTEGTITINVHSGYGKKIYAVANAGSRDYSTQVTTEDDLRKLTTSLTDASLNRISFLMAGSLFRDGNGGEVQAVDIDEKGNIYPSGSSTPMAEPTIYLHRLDARVTFQITLDVKDDGYTVSEANFTPTDFEVHNLPLTSHLFPQGTVPRTKEEDYVSMTRQNFDSEKDDISFNFYMFENNCVVPASDTKHYITEAVKGDASNLYALREKKAEDNSFVYAPDTATYVVIHGDLSYKRNKGDIIQYVNEAATYIVHLGETGTTADDWDNPAKVNNYVVARNTHYTYTVTIQGVNSIRVEVKNEEETQPGHEGDVIVAGNYVKQLDCHFGRAQFRLSRKALQGDGLSWTIQTPFDRGIKLATDKQNNRTDYKWVLFAINAEFGIDEKEIWVGQGQDRNRVNMVKFPGYRAYDGGASTTGAAVGNDNTDMGNSSENVLGNQDVQPWKKHMPEDNFYHKYIEDPKLKDNACLRDVNQLLNYLHEMADAETDYANSLFVKDDDGEEYVYITAFIDEYVYRYDPRIEEYISPDRSFQDGNPDDERRKLLWKETVNSEPRMMHICAEVPQYSSDGNSSWTESVVSFIQQPVYSIYDEKAKGLESAWGTETIIEGDKLKATSTRLHVNSFTLNYKSYEFTNDNGRVNTLMFFVNGNGTSNGKKWSEILNRTDDQLNSPDGGELKGLYRDIWHACLMRNRDLNGNDMVEPGEIRWFLASIDELTDIWIGEDALPSSAKLYQEDGTVRAHVASSSGSATDPWVIWAEEGASRGYLSGDGGYSGANDNKYYYRCLRFLGISLDDIGETPQDYVQVDEGNCTIKLTYLSPQAKRDAPDNGLELPKHTERGSDDINKPYTGGFKYDLTPYGQGNEDMKWNVFSSYLNYGGSSKLCAPGYRVPNQRELMLMMTSIPSWTFGQYWSSTQFSFNGNSLYRSWIYGQWVGNRPGFATDGENLILTRWPDNGWDNISAKVRGVCDIVTP